MGFTWIIKTSQRRDWCLAGIAKQYFNAIFAAKTQVFKIKNPWKARSWELDVNLQNIYWRLSGSIRLLTPFAKRKTNISWALHRTDHWNHLLLPYSVCILQVFLSKSNYFVSDFCLTFVWKLNKLWEWMGRIGNRRICIKRG